MADDEEITEEVTEEAPEDDATPAGDDSAATAGDDSAAPAGAGVDDGKDVEFIEYVVKHIVENPEEVQIERTVDEMGVLITLKVSKDDMGKLIGKNGQTAKALRTLLRIIGSKNNARVNLKIVEPEGAE